MRAQRRADIYEDTYESTHMRAQRRKADAKTGKHGHFTRGIFYGNLKEKNAAHYSAHLD